MGPALPDEEKSDAPPAFQGRQTIERRRTIYREAEPVKRLYVIREGWAFRFLLAQDGRRQILSFLMAGDLISPSSIFAERHDFSVQSISSLGVCVFDIRRLREKCRTDERFMQEVTSICLAEKQHMETRLFELGRCRADERLARLFLFLAGRRQKASVEGGKDMFPLRQQDLADATGLTQVHVSRVLQSFRERGVIDDNRKGIQVLDMQYLRRIALGGPEAA
ncbi:Crp/Fnr family transcriptional regulator [Tepidicaulis sp. LMO-SS28]|uniref:Crp/Fnr family transcriptional regulator n=1 Tax=Tepidicaulis sp. LMO-SS28 TaxID=3447455 RepID=UPI003EE00887